MELKIGKRDLPKNWKEADEYMNISNKMRSSIHSVPFYCGIILLGYLFSVVVIVYYIDSSLPTAIKVEDEAIYPDAFIAERAMRDLELLTNLGPRVVGSYENEVLTVDFLKDKIEEIKINSNPNQKLELDVQLTSGSFYIDLIKTDGVNVYTNVQNVVVKLHGMNNSDVSILINSHFDSVPTSPGGSDDGISVVAMLEVMRKISKEPRRPLHNIIFLFNGAEETALHASHGFITQHKWAKSCKVFLNLEAAGAGGKITLFQSGPEAPWLLQVFKQAPHPTGQVAGEEIFQSGLIPSDTDFRIFRDFGNIVGMDMAFYKYGYRYHTKYDNFKNIPPGSFQHIGDNTLHIVKKMANAPELYGELRSGDKVIYFDVFSWFMMAYSLTTATIANCLIIFLSCSVFVWSLIDFKLGVSTSIKYLTILFGGILGGWVVAFLFIGLVASLLDLLNTSMSWYGTPVLIAGLFAIPTIAITSHILSLIKEKKLALNVRLQMQVHVVRIIWTIVLLAGTILKVRSVYPVTVLVCFSTIPFPFIHALRWHYSIRKWQVMYLVFLIVPTMLTIYEFLIAFHLFIPLTGRIGSDKNPDLIIGCLTTFATILVTSPYIALSSILRQGKYFFVLLWTIFLVTLVIVFTPLGFPYSGNSVNPTPQRQWITHAQRIFHNETGHVIKTEGGIFLLNMDRNSPNYIKKYVTDLNKAKSLKEDCDQYILCGLPLSHVKMTQIMQQSTWIPASQPVLPFTSKLIVNSKERVTPSLVRYNVSMTGPDRQHIFLVPKDGMKFVKTSIIDQLPDVKLQFKGRPMLHINSIAGENPTTLTVTFDVEVPPDHIGATVDIAISSIHVHSKLTVKSPYYIKLLAQFPDWTDVTPYVASYAAHII